MTTNKTNLTYQEVKLRLTRCEERLEQLKIKDNGKVDYSKQISKMKILKESLQKKLKESEENMFVTTKAGDTKAVSMTKKQAIDLKKDSNVTDITTTKGADLKEQEGIEFSKSETIAIAKEVGKALAKALRTAGDEIDSMKITEIEPNSFDIKLTYKNDSEDRYSFYIVDDTLNLVNFDMDKELIDVGVKPSGEAIIHIDVLANELLKHFKSLNEMKPGDREDLEQQRKARLSSKDQKTLEKIQALVRAEKEKQGEKDLEEMNDYNEEDLETPNDEGDLDIGHQDDEPGMLKQSVYEIAEYAAKLYKQLNKYDKMDTEVDFPNWWQSKVILAREYISKAQHYLEFEEKQPALDQLALEGKINETYNINPEAEKTVVRFIKGLAKKYGYGMEDAAFLIKQVLSNQGLEEQDKGASAEEEEKFHQDLDKLVHKTFGKGEHEKSVNEESHAKLQKKHSEVISKMKELAKQYKAGDKSVVVQLKDLTATKKKLEADIEKAISGIGVGQEYDDSVEESKKQKKKVSSRLNEGAEEIMNSYNKVLDLVKQLSRRLDDDDSYAFGLKLRSWFEKNIHK